MPYRWRSIGYFVTSGYACAPPPFQGNPEGVGGRLMTSLPVKGPHLGGYCAISACAHPTLPSEPLGGHMTFCHVTSVSHVGHAQWYILYYYYSKKKVRGESGHAQAITSGHVTSSSGYVTSGDVTSGSTSSHLLKCGFGCPYILLSCLLWKLPYWLID